MWLKSATFGMEPGLLVDGVEVVEDHVEKDPAGACGIATGDGGAGVRTGAGTTADRIRTES